MSCLIALFAGLTALRAATPATAPALRFTSDAPGHNFIAETGALTLEIGTGLNVTGGEVKLSDERGRPLQTLKVAPDSTLLTIALPGRGYYKLTANLTRKGAEPLQASTSAAVVGPLLPNEARLASPFGFFSVTGDTPLQVIAGTGWDRLFIPLNGVERDPSGELKWWRPNAPGPRAPESINGTPAPLQWVGVFTYPPRDVIAPELRAKHNNHNVYPPTDWDAFAQRVQFAVKHYAKWVRYFEPINEPDANWRGTDEQLVRYHQVMADAIHAVDPALKVVGPCLTRVDLPRLRKLAALGLFDQLDGLSIHPYANDAPPEGKWWSEVRQLREFLRTIGKEDMPIVISEYGWQTAPGDWARPVDELTQARYAARSLTLLAAAQVDAINYFCLRYEDSRLPWVQGWSVVEHDLSPRPAFAAIANLTRRLSGVQGQGTVLHPAPDTYLVLFRKGAGGVAVGWTTRGESRLQLPGGVGTIIDMMGRPVAPQEQGLVSLSESPTYIELNDPMLPAITLRDPVSVVRGSSLTLAGDWTGASVAAPLTINGNQLTVPGRTPAGEYLVMGKTAAGQWQAAPVKVLPQFAVESAQPYWAGDQPAPVVRLTVQSHGQTMDLLPSVRLHGAATRFGPRVSVPAGQQRTVDVPLGDLPLGRRWGGTAAVEGRVNGNAEESETALQITLVPGAGVADTQPIDWSAVPVVNSAGWRAFGGTPADAPLDSADCSARLQWAYNQRGLHFRVEVEDDVHVQDRDPAQMWQQDSLQFAFDVDADKPWRANVNNQQVGLNGHRIFEYGVSLRDGQALTARWRESIVTLSGDVPPIAAEISRQGTRTIYNVTFPWPVLGLDAAPAPGTSIGFDLVINDADTPQKRRHGLEIFGGINASKDPERFGVLLLR